MCEDEIVGVYSYILVFFFFCVFFIVCKVVEFHPSPCPGYYLRLSVYL